MRKRTSYRSIKFSSRDTSHLTNGSSSFVVDHITLVFQEAIYELVHLSMDAEFTSPDQSSIEEEGGGKYDLLWIIFHYFRSEPNQHTDGIRTSENSGTSFGRQLLNHLGNGHSITLTNQI
jgi:hypothetical protein